MRRGVLVQLSLVASLGCGILDSGPTFTVQGTVTATHDSAPIEGASVTVRTCVDGDLLNIDGNCDEWEELASDLTDSLGAYVVSWQGTCLGSIIEATHADYQPAFRSMLVNDCRQALDIQTIDFFPTPVQSP
jgi:hypothetical protein